MINKMTMQQQSNGPDFCIQLTVSVSVLQDVINIERLREGNYTGFIGNATAVVS